MRVIIVGASKVAYALMKQISQEDVDIIVIDKQESAINEITDAFDCNGYVGNGSSPKLLLKAGVESTSLLVALTKSDETNILCCSVAKKLGVKRTVAAVRDAEYRADKAFLLEKMGIDLVVNPDMAAAREVNKMIRYAGHVEIERFDDGDVAVATVPIDAGSILADVMLTEVQQRLGEPILICAIDRGGKIITPKGKHQIKAGDKITFVAIGDSMDTILTRLNVLEKVVKKVAVVGAGRVGRYLTNILLAQRIKVTVIEKDAERCREIQEMLPKAHVVCGDGTDAELVEGELKGMDACVTLTGRDEVNLIISTFAKSLGMDRIAAEIDNANYDAMLRRSGINHTFSTQDVAIATIVRDMRLLVAEEDDKDNNVIKWLYNLNGGKVEAMEFELTEEFPKFNIPFKDPKFNLKAGVLIAVIIRDGAAIVPDGNSALQPGDCVIIVSTEHKISKLTEIFA